MKKWQELFNKRELQLIENCKTYAEDCPAGLPGHNLMLIIHKMGGMLQIQDKSLDELFKLSTRSDLTALRIGDKEVVYLSELDYLTQEQLKTPKITALG